MSIQIKSNIGARLKKIREGVVYDSITSVLGELAQNTQRSKAVGVDVIIEGRMIRMTDDGDGCTDPQSVFELDSSGWGLEEAFGEGFFSTFTVADDIVVRSGDWRATVHVVDVIEHGDVDVTVERGLYPIQGFEVELLGDRIAEHTDELVQFMRELGELMPQQVTLNGEEVKKKDLSKIKDAPMVHAVDNEKYTGWLAPATGYSAYVRFFYESRFVCQEWVSGVKGNVVLKAGAVSLKAPDRRSIVYDGKRYELFDKLHEDTKSMYMVFVQDATNENLDKYAEPVAEYLNVEQYLYLLPMDDKTLQGQKQDVEVDPLKQLSDEELLKKFKMGAREHTGGYGSTSGGEALLPDGGDPANLPPTDDPRYEGNRVSNHRLLKLKEKAKRTTERQVEKLKKLGDKHKVAWVRASEMEDMQEAIKELEYYGFKVISARNRLYERCFEHLGINSIQDVEQCVEKKFSLSNIGAGTKKEQRVMWMLQMIEKHYGIGSTFRIADIEEEVVHSRNGHVVLREKRNTYGVYKETDKTKRIYIDRRNLQLPSYRVDKWDSGNLSLNDLRMMLKNIETVAHELAHMLYKTKDNTKEHTDAQSRLIKEIAELF